MAQLQACVPILKNNVEQKVEQEMDIGVVISLWSAAVGASEIREKLVWDHSD